MFSVRPVAVAATAHCAKRKQLNLQCHPSIQPSRKLTTHLPFYRNFKMLTYLQPNVTVPTSQGQILLHISFCSIETFSCVYAQRLLHGLSECTVTGLALPTAFMFLSRSDNSPPKNTNTIYYADMQFSIISIFFAFCVFHLDYFKVSWSHKKKEKNFSSWKKTLEDVAHDKEDCLNYLRCTWKLMHYVDGPILL